MTPLSFAEDQDQEMGSGSESDDEPVVLTPALARKLQKLIAEGGIQLLLSRVSSKSAPVVIKKRKSPSSSQLAEDESQPEPTQ